MIKNGLRNPLRLGQDDASGWTRRDMQCRRMTTDSKQTWNQAESGGKAKATATELYLSFGLRGREPEKPRTYPSKNGAAVEQRIKRLDHEHSRSRSKSRERASSRTKARADNSSPIAPHHDKVSKRPHLTRGYSRRRRWERQNPTRIGLHHLEPFPRS